MLFLPTIRGNSGLYPEESLGSFLSGVEAGADYIECDIQFSQDLVPVCMHDYWLSRVTDVADKPGKLGSKGSVGSQMWQTSKASWAAKAQQGHRCGRQARQVG